MEDLKPIFVLMYIFLLVIPSLPKYLKYGPTASDMIRDLQHLKRHRNLLGIHSPFCSHKKPISHAIFSIMSMFPFPLLLGNILVRKEISKYLKP